MFAVLSDYMDGLVDDKHTREMEKHLDDCKPCVAFLESRLYGALTPRFQEQSITSEDK
jgi:hypothetical protein